MSLLKDDLKKSIIDLEGKEPPETNPYKYKYESRTLLEKALKSNTSSLTECKDENEKESKQLYITFINYELGLNYIDCEENTVGISYLEKVITFLFKKLEYRILYGHILIKSLNLLGLILSNRNELKKAKTYLDKCEQIYKECENEKNEKIYNKLNKNDNILYKNIRENEYTLTLYYFSQIYLHLNNSDKSSFYVQKTLQRQLLNKDKLNVVEWVKNAIGLSEYYITVRQYRQSIHVMECASKLLTNNPGNIKDKETEKQINADLNRGWGELYYNMLQDSYNAMNNVENDGDNSSNNKKKDENDSKKDEMKNKDELVDNTQNLVNLESELELNNTLNKFHGIKVQQPPELHLSSTYDEAKELFKPGLKHYQLSLKYYILDGFVTDNIQINQKISLLYKYIAFFEKDLSTKCKLHKRRINILTPIESKLSLKIYTSDVLSLCFELGNVYEEMGSLKLKILEKSKSNDDKKTQKINDLFKKGISYLEKFITINEYPPGSNQDKKVKAVIIDENKFSYLQAKFLIAAIYNKLIATNAKEHIGFLEHSVKTYQFIVDYVKKNGEIKEFKDQYDISKQLKDLLPLKIDKIKLSME